MNANSSQRNYLRAAVQEASPAGLVIILYDLLVNDLHGAIHAIRCGAIEERSRHLKHALLVLQFLEGSLDKQEEATAARSLSAFYAHLRRQVLDAQFRNDDSTLVRQIALVLDVREAWRTADSPSPTIAAFDKLDDSTSDEPTRWSA